MENEKNVAKSGCTDADFQVVVPDYLSGRFDGPAAQRFEVHAKSCEDCQLNLDLWLFMIEERFSHSRVRPGRTRR